MLIINDKNLIEIKIYSSFNSEFVMNPAKKKREL